VSEAALDLRPAELGFLVPLVAILLLLSAWPAAITDRSFAGRPRSTTQSQFAAARLTSRSVSSTPVFP
jgi:hypothetical protein